MTPVVLVECIPAAVLLAAAHTGEAQQVITQFGLRCDSCSDYTVWFAV